MPRHTQLSNGAVVSSYGVYSTSPVTHHTLIVVGQHGSERGPILGAAGWEPPVGSAMTIVRLANPWGFAAQDRAYQTSATLGRRGPDLNREWGQPGTIADEIWQTVLEHSGRAPDRVVDLHSSPAHVPGDRVLGLLVLAASERDRLSLAEPLAAMLRDVEPGWASWSPECTRGVTPRASDHEGTLLAWAASQGAEAIVVEFADDLPAEQPTAGLLPGERVREIGDSGRRDRTTHESMLGVVPLLKWLGQDSKTLNLRQ